MPKNTEHISTDSQHENYFDAASLQNESLDEIDAEAMFLPEGGIVMNARFADDNGQNVTEIRIDKDGRKTGLIDGEPIGDEQIVRLGEVLGVDLSGSVNPNELDVEADSPLIDSLDRGTSDVKKE